MKKKIYKIAIAATFCFAFMYNFQIESKKTDDSLVHKNFIATANAVDPIPVKPGKYFVVNVPGGFDCYNGGKYECPN